MITRLGAVAACVLAAVSVVAGSAIARSASPSRRAPVVTRHATRQTTRVKRCARGRRGTRCRAQERAATLLAYAAAARQRKRQPSSSSTTSRSTTTSSPSSSAPAKSSSSSSTSTTTSSPTATSTSSAPAPPAAAQSSASTSSTTPPSPATGTTTTPPSTGSGTGSGTTTTPPSSGSGSGTTTTPPSTGSGTGTGTTTTPPSTGAGTGTTTTPPSTGSTTPPSTSAPATISQSHIETWAYDDCGNGGTTAPASVVRAWVTYAEANCGPAGDTKTLSDCHSGATVFCDVIAYLDTNWIYPGSTPTWPQFSSASSESWFQHVAGSTTTRVSTTAYGGGYLINQANPGVQSFFQNYVRTNYNGVDGLMMDDTSASMSGQLWDSGCYCSTDEEFGSDAQLDAAHTAMSAAMTHSNGQPFLQIDNGLAPNSYLPQGFNLLNPSTDVQGMITEGAPEDDGTLDPYYSTLLDQIAYVANNTSGFVVPLSYAPAGASYQAQSRRVQEATILLGYSPGHLVDWADLESGSENLGVWPEEGIYPTQPLQTMGAPTGAGCLAGGGIVCTGGGHNDVQVAPGVYRREFGACYDQGQLFGACAAIVNTTSSPVTISASWLTGSYSHEITFSGGDVQSGGTVNLAGAPFTAGSTTVGADDAALLAP